MHNCVVQYIPHIVFRGVMYIKSEFKKISSFAHITRGWFWGSYRDIFGALRGPNSGFEGGGGFTGGGVSGGSW